MRKSGLHKQISSIFDGVPVPQNNGLPDDADASSVPMQPEPQDNAETAAGNQNVPPSIAQEPVSEPKENKAPLLRRMSADPSECASAPAIQVNRPMPLPKSSVSSAKTGPSLSSQIKKAAFGSKSLDARQKKMATLVGILSVVFGVVMFVSLGGVGQSQATAAEETTDNQTAQAQGTKKSAQDWKNPQPLPAGLRDATTTVSRTATSSHGSPTDTVENAVSGQLVVKGIVFSKNTPSAIINNEILSEGENYNGITIVKITKDSVEFEVNEKRWTQQVQR